MLRALTLRPGDHYVIRSALALSMDKLEEYAASELWWQGMPKYREESRLSMREHLGEFRRCHELRQKLLSA